MTFDGPTLTAMALCITAAGVVLNTVLTFLTNRRVTSVEGKTVEIAKSIDGMKTALVTAEKSVSFTAGAAEQREAPEAIVVAPPTPPAPAT